LAPLLLVLFVMGIGGYLFTHADNSQVRKIEEEHILEARKIEEQRIEKARKLEINPSAVEECQSGRRTAIPGMRSKSGSLVAR
jgi:hypothetical protein